MKENPIHQDRGSATGRAILERRVVHIPDALSDVDYRWGVNIRSGKEMHRTILAAPMLKGDAIIGVRLLSAGDWLLRGDRPQRTAREQ
jgi:hypothetical protein